ncbi:MAG: histidine kinase [Bacteroidota bacterium]
MKRTRFALYLLIAFLVTMLDFMSEIGEGILEEELFFAVQTLPAVLGTCYLQFHIRKWIFGTKLYRAVLSKGPTFRRLFWSVVVIAKAGLLAVIARGLSTLLLPEFDSGVFFDLLFWGVFIGTLCIGLFVYALESFIELQQEKQGFQLRLKEHENEKLVAKFLNLKKQLNPHFLFNSFNSLSGLIAMDPNKAEYFLSELSNVYRYTLDQSDELVVPLEKELELIRSYVALQKIRFGDSLKVEYNISAEDLRKMIPPMTLELLIENAIKHNVVEKENPLEIFVRTLGTYAVVSNNYQPRTDSGTERSSSGMGLKNLKNQYGMIHNEEPRFDVRNGKYVAIIPLIEPD